MCIRDSFHVDFFLHHCRKMGIADQLYYHFGYGIVEKFFPYLLTVIAFIPALHTAAFELASNPDYYDADSISLDGLAYQVIKDRQQDLMSYQTGALDMTLLNGEQVDQVKDCLLYTSRLSGSCGG